MAARHQAEGTQDLKDGHLGLDVVRAEALRDGVDPGDVGEDVRAPRGVVHDRLDAAERGRVDGGLRAVPVQPRQQAKKTGEALPGDT